MAAFGPYGKRSSLFRAQLDVCALAAGFQNIHELIHKVLGLPKIKVPRNPFSKFSDVDSQSGTATEREIASSLQAVSESTDRNERSCFRQAVFHTFYSSLDSKASTAEYFAFVVQSKSDIELSHRQNNDVKNEHVALQAAHDSLTDGLAQEEVTDAEFARHYKCVV